MGAQRRAFLSRNNVPTAAVVAVLSPVVYWWWEDSHEVDVNPIGLLLAAVLPIVVLLALGWAWYRVQAPAQVYAPMRKHYDAAHPPPPYAVSAQVEPDGISLTLLPSQHHSSPVLPIASASCYLHLAHHRPVSRETFGPHELSSANPLRVVYPDDFEHADWPLEPGQHQFGWEVREPSGRTYTIGRAVTVT